MDNFKISLEKDIKSKILRYNIIKELKQFNGVIAGGAITSIFVGNKINDIDIYFKTGEDLEKAKAHIASKKSKILSETKNAITYEIDSNFLRKPLVIQFIIAKELIKEDPMDLISSFDFTINMAAYDLDKEELIVKKEFFIDNIKRNLVFNEDTLYPIISMHRAIKYMNRDYKLNGDEQVKIALAINNLHMKNYRDLKRQLQGIDTLHFKSITDKLMEKPDTEYSYGDTLSLMRENKVGEDNENECF